MSLLAVIGAVLQLTLLLFQQWVKWGDEKKQERKVLYDEAKKAISSRDASAITIAFGRMRNL